jgi:hypothetical protein
VSILVIVALMQAFLAAWNAPPASLGELALREAVRRAATPAPTRVLTEADLGPVPERPVPSVLQVMPAVPPPVVIVDETLRAVKPGENVEKNETWWRARMVKARVDLERDRLVVTALETRVNALTRDVAGRDAPGQRAALVAERERTLAELERMRNQVTDGVKAISDIEDEARREGVPPGWLRGG